MRFLKQCDYFGYPVLPYYKGEDNYGSFFGGMTSILLVSVGLGMLIMLLVDFLSLRAIDSSLQIDYSASTVGLLLNGSNFFFMLGVPDLDLNGPSPFEINAVYIVKVNGTNNYTSVPLQKCSNLNSFLQPYRINQIQKKLCTPLNYTAQLSGTFSYPVFRYLRLEVSKCKKNINCQPLQNRTFSFLLYLSNFEVNPYSQGEPAQLHLQQVYELEVDFGKLSILADIRLSLSELYTDTGVYFFKNVSRQSGIFHQKQTNILRYNPPASYLIRFYFLPSGRIFTFSRSYANFNKSLSLLGGMMTLLLFLGQIVIFNFNKFKLHVSLANQLFYQDGGIGRSPARLDLGGNDYLGSRLLQKLLSNCRIKSGFLDYGRYCAQRFMSLFGWQASNWAVGMSEIARAVDDQLQMSKFLKELSFHKKALSFLFSNNQLSLLKLLISKDPAKFLWSRPQRFTEGQYHKQLSELAEQFKAGESLQGFDQIMQSFREVRQSGNFKIIQILEKHPCFGQAFKNIK